MKNILKNWKTTTTGLVMSVGAIVTYINDKSQLIPALTAFFAGLGLIIAKDSDQTGVK